MSLARCLPVVVLMLQAFGSPAEAEWVNNWDEEAKLECPENGIFSYIGSIHNNYYEDRRWIFNCKESPVPLVNCRWTDYINGFDELLKFSCGENEALTGMNSYHNNYYEDRRFQMKCCAWSQPDQVKRTDCAFTNFINEWDGDMTYSVPTAKYIRGVFSVHDNYREDRIWKIEECNI